MLEHENPPFSNEIYEIIVRVKLTSIHNKYVGKAIILF